MLVHCLLLVIGMVLLLAAAEAVVRGSSGLARNLGVSPIAVGLTVVAFGTSAPEFAVNVMAATRGTTELAFGNIIGSNIANVGLVIGCAAAIRPIAVESVIIRREVPMMLLATAAALAMGIRWNDGGDAQFSQRDGIVLLVFFAMFLFYTIADVFRQRASDPLVVQTGLVTPLRLREPLSLNVGLTIGGLAVVIGGAELTVRSALALAADLGVSSTLIGLTIVAIGTSLPELATSVLAAWRGQSDLAVGNILGSNIFNLLFIAGASASIHPIPVPQRGNVDMLVMAGLALLLVPFCSSHSQRIIRREAALLLLIYVAYTTWRVAF